MQNRKSKIPIAALLVFLCAGASGRQLDKCAQLSQVTLADTTVTTAKSMEAGDFAPPYGERIEKLPAFCRVAGILKPTSDSYIRFEVWLPASGWNKRYLGVGNGGFAGSISYNSLANDLKRGYATAATDTGH